VVDQQRLVDDRNAHSIARDSLCMQRTHSQARILALLQDRLPIETGRHLLGRRPDGLLVETREQQILEGIPEIEAGNVIRTEIHLPLFIGIGIVDGQLGQRPPQGIPRAGMPVDLRKDDRKGSRRDRGKRCISGGLIGGRRGLSGRGRGLAGAQSEQKERQDRE
jgi:hypothetical protein